MSQTALGGLPSLAIGVAANRKRSLLRPYRLAGSCRRFLGSRALRSVTIASTEATTVHYAVQFLSNHHIHQADGSYCPGFCSPAFPNTEPQPVQISASIQHFHGSRGSPE